MASPVPMEVRELAASLCPAATRARAQAEGKEAADAKANHDQTQQVEPLALGQPEDRKPAGHHKEHDQQRLRAGTCFVQRLLAKRPKTAPKKKC